MSLSKCLAREQRAYLNRPRGAWGAHLVKARAFFGEALQAADPDLSVLILGAGSGLEIPWKLAPKHSVGWDADPWSRWRTCLRHQRFPDWIYDDLTGGIADLEATARRCLILPTGRHRSAEQAVRRFAGLLPSLHPRPRALEAWVAGHRPSSILVANFLGQVGSVIQKILEAIFGGAALWAEYLETTEGLAEAVDAWIVRALEALLGCLRGSRAQVWMLHDRAVIWGNVALELGRLQDPWMRQLQASTSLEVSDPLCGIDVRGQFSDRTELRFDRWLWPVGTGQLHMMEALAYSS